MDHFISCHLYRIYVLYPAVLYRRTSVYCILSLAVSYTEYVIRDSVYFAMQDNRTQDRIFALRRNNLVPGTHFFNTFPVPYFRVLY